MIKDHNKIIQEYSDLQKVAASVGICDPKMDEICKQERVLAMQLAMTSGPEASIEKLRLAIQRIDERDMLNENQIADREIMILLKSALLDMTLIGHPDIEPL